MIFLMRHGQGVFNAEGRLQGCLDSALTESGRLQAYDLADRIRTILARPEEAKIVSSPQGRAMATAELIRSGLGTQDPIQCDDRLREISFGSWEGLTPAEIETRWPGESGDLRFARAGWRHALMANPTTPLLTG